MELHGECESEFSGDERSGVGRDRVEVMNLAGESRSEFGESRDLSMCYGDAYHVVSFFLVYYMQARWSVIGCNNLRVTDSRPRI